MRKQINFCTQCGHAVTIRTPDDGDVMRRAVCPYCDHIQYQNPLLVVGTIPHQGDQILMCQRNIEPGKGLWTLPSGYMEIGETLAEAAIRETREEAGATVALQSLFTILSSATFGHPVECPRLFFSTHNIASLF
jgi:ADP-ribose pyrophosphatase YjhB (NUDIX family)